MVNTKRASDESAKTSTAHGNFIFCDISAIVHLDRRTGIERVVRAIATELIASPPINFEVETAYVADGVPYRARQSFSKTPSSNPHDSPLEEISASAGDHYLLLDWAPDRILALEDWLLAFRARGGIVTAVVYDLIPLDKPEYFPAWLRHTVSDWLSFLLRVTDHVACISRAVADDFARLTRKIPIRTPVSLSYFHLGFDVGSSRPSCGSTAAEEAAIAKLDQRPTFLMVGTVEPRKGHVQIFDAFDLLWEEGLDVGLIIVGKEGWMVEDAAAAMRGHPKNRDHFFWLSSASDEVLTKLFANAVALIAASKAEGFGLPLVEAADHGLPIIARDLPVFREVAGEHAFYFQGETAADAAAAVKNWLALPAQKRPMSSGMAKISWAEATSQLTEVMFETRTYLTSARSSDMAP